MNFLPSCLIHRILSVDVTSVSMKNGIQMLADTTRIEWDCSPSVAVIDVDKGEVGGYIISSFPRSVVTVIPVYDWFKNRVGVTNPFEVDWIGLDLTDDDDVLFIGSVINDLLPVVYRWSGDPLSVDNDVLCMCLRFINRLENLYAHAIDMRALRLDVIGVDGVLPIGLQGEREGDYFFNDDGGYTTTSSFMEEE